MVQLKSFKFIEPEAHLDSSSAGSGGSASLAAVVTATGSWASTNSPSASLTGGNLTQGGESSSSFTSEPASRQVASPGKQEQRLPDEANPTSATTPTLSAGSGSGGVAGGSLESQEAKLSMRTEDDDDNDGGLQLALGEQSDIREHEDEIADTIPALITEQVAGGRGAMVGARASPMPMKVPAAGLRYSLSQHQSAPEVGGLEFGANSRAANILLQQQFLLQQQAAAQNQFEIRWHKVRLERRATSILPKFVTNNPLYRLFKGQEEPEELLPACSPPLAHKHALGFAGLGATSGFKGPKDMAKQASDMSPQPPPSQQVPPINNIVLDSISGSVFSGQLTAILGPSGVGKTTLLNSLTGRNTLEGSGRVSLVSSARYQSKRLSVVTVPQVDVLPDKLTAREDLEFTSRLKNPDRKFDHAANIERIVKHLHMQKFLDTRIERLSGGEARRLSIGRELLSSPDIMILDEPTSGLDANTCKKIITALRDIVEQSDNILGRPMSIIVTIHQPQQEVLNLFHRVYVMALGGRAIYEGPPTSLRAALLTQSSLAQMCNVENLNENPAIVALEVASGEYGPQIIEELAAFHEQEIADDFSLYQSSLNLGDAQQSLGEASPMATPALRRPPGAMSPAGRPHRPRLNSAGATSLGRATPLIGYRAKQAAIGRAQMDRISQVTSVSYASTYDAELPEPFSPKLKVDKRLRRSVVMKGDFLRHTMTLIGRAWLLSTRNMFLMAIRLIGFVLVAMGMVQIFSHALDPNENQCPLFESEVNDLIGFMQASKERLLNLDLTLKQASSTHLYFFHLVLCITMVVSALSGLVFPLQMRMFIREFKNGWYSPASFIMSQTLADLPVDMLGPLISLVIAYPLCHQPAGLYYWRYIVSSLVIILASVICKSQAQIVGAIFMDSVENSVFISCVMVTGPALLSGIAVRIKQMPWILQQISYGSFLRYAFESLFVLRYGYGICPCDPEVVNGYPIRASEAAIPPHLDSLARNFVADLTTATSLQQQINSTTNSSILDNNSTTLQVDTQSREENIFVGFLRLVADASNLFSHNAAQLGDCSNYRSLYLLDMDIDDSILINWIVVLLVYFVISRFLTYFVVKTVINMRRQ